MSDALVTALQNDMPLAMAALKIDRQRIGLIIVDEVNGFAKVGGGNLAPPAPNAQVATMVSETDRLAKSFSAQAWPVLAFLDTHIPGKPEPPYPPHCEAGTGEEELIDDLKWLESDPHTTLIRKDCINGFIGAILPDGTNQVVEWVMSNQLQQLLVVGICTDICVMDFVLTMLSARNHDMMPGLEDILVYDAGCSTFDLPKDVAVELGFGEAAAHPQNATHHLGLYFMASRGAVLINEVEI